jgi:two-component system OmpR family response regulator
VSSLNSILLVEDDYNIAEALSQALNNNFDVDIAPTGRIAIYKADINHYDLIILDLNLPDMTGLTICQLLRERGTTAPILILTANSGVLSKIKLLDAGANDYLTKPFSLGELKARLRVLSRYTENGATKINQRAACGLLIDRATYTVKRDDILIKLRRKEFALLECLIEHAGSVASRATLSRFAWQDDEKVWTNTIDVHIKHLRDKIDRPFGSKLIKTVHGMGYKLEEPVYELDEKQI